MAQIVLIVDDDPVQRRLLENMVQRFGYEALCAEGGDAALQRLAEPDRSVDCVILDLVMPDLDGLGVLTRMRERGWSQPVIVQTAHGGIDNVVSAMRAGATDFVVKPVGAERLQVSLQNALARGALEIELQRLKRSRTGSLTFQDIVTRSPGMESLLRMAEKAAGSAIPVLIEGESGVGKELIAQAIHGSGPRRAKPFVAVNCGAIPDNLVESTLFGHEKGAFTGATERHAGKFVEASGGTLFLDEVGELPPSAQVKLLRALQEGVVDPVGGRRPVKVDLRIISATNRNLLSAVKEGRFREDLFYRLHVFPLTVPPLRERREDIPELVRRFLARFAAEEGKRVRLITGEAMQVLSAHDWPGNVRQLENAVFRAVVLAESDEIGLSEFPQIAGSAGNRPAIARGAANHAEAIPDRDKPGDGKAVEMPPLVMSGPDIAPACGDTKPDAADSLLLDVSGEVRPLEEVEADVIRFAIARYRGQMSEVARRLRIGRSTLYRKLKEFGLDSPETEQCATAGVAQE